ncbi:MAG: alpha-L-fucosidase [Clostridia bacterium]
MACFLKKIFGKKTEKFNYFEQTTPILVEESAFDIGKTNNGKEKYSEYISKLIATTPSARQLNYLEMEKYAFIHFGINTFSNREWGDGAESESIFNPTNLDTDQWCRIIKQAGLAGVIITAKHHDGFCLWQTQTTEHSIKNSPYKNGAGDIVKELAESAKKAGLKFGVYLSPWDMNSKFYGHNTYNNFYLKQLQELTTNYGDLFSVWFDGACGAKNIDKDFAYDFESFYALIRKNQPNAVLAVSAPDVRWIGNEGGHARKCEWSVVCDLQTNQDKIAELSQQNPEMAKKLAEINSFNEDLGSREYLKSFDNFVFYPAEMDVSIRKSWFYHKKETPKTATQLEFIYYKSVGANASLLLNLPVDKRGLIDEKDEKVLLEFGNKIKQDKANKIEYTASVGGKNTTQKEELKALFAEDSSSYKFKNDEYILDLTLKNLERVKIVDLRENLQYSQRIEQFSVYAKVDAGWLLLANSTNIGNRRTIIFDDKNVVATNCVRIVIEQSRDNPVLRSVCLYK